MVGIVNDAVCVGATVAERVDARTAEAIGWPCEELGRNLNAGQYQ